MLNGPFSDVGCKTVANMIKGKTPEEIRKLFNIVMTKVESSVLVCKPRYLPTMTDSSNLFIFCMTSVLAQLCLQMPPQFHHARPLCAYNRSTACGT